VLALLLVLVLGRRGQCQGSLFQATLSSVSSLLGVFLVPRMHCGTEAPSFGFGL
jgi:hypothetical protein